MRRLGWISFGLGLLLAGASHATIIASGGGPSITVQGELQAFAVDPLPINQDDFYDESRIDANGNGAVPGSAFDSVAGSVAQYDGEATVANSSASASYGYDFVHLGGSLAGGAMSLSTFSSIGIDESYFQGANDYAGAHSVAQAINFMDLAVTDVDYLLAFDGGVQDDLIPTLNGGGSVFFFVADITSGFTFLGLYGDTTPGDFAPTPFADAFTLEAGRQYRVGLGASTNALCSELNLPGFCPTVNGSGDPLDVQTPDFYGQSAAVDFGFSLVPVPEPGTVILLGAGVTLLAHKRRV